MCSYSAGDSSSWTSEGSEKQRGASRRSRPAGAKGWGSGGRQDPGGRLGPEAGEVVPPVEFTRAEMHGASEGRDPAGPEAVLFVPGRRPAATS